MIHLQPASKANVCVQWRLAAFQRFCLIAPLTHAGKIAARIVRRTGSVKLDATYSQPL